MDVFPYLAVLLSEVAGSGMWLALAVMLLAGAALLRQRRSIGAKFLAGILLALGGFLAFSGTYQFWYTHRPLPALTGQMLFEGVRYIREVRSEPRPLVIHVVQIDLNTPGLRFLVTPGQREYALPARTTSQFLSEFSLQLAINGDSFSPWWSKGIFNYYPRAGDPVHIKGFASSAGMIYSPDNPESPTLYISADNRVTINRTPDSVYNAISGLLLIVEDGQAVIDRSRGQDELHPRTAVGIDEAGTTLALLLVDGRQPNYSEGVTLDELAGIALEHGLYTALNLDGGGSTALVIEGENGAPVVLNSPIDLGIPGRERAVGNHLGLYLDNL